MFKDKVVVVTGGANGIGRCIADEFRSQGAVVYVIDKQEGEHFVGDISKKEVLEAFAAEVLSKHDKVDVIVNNALPLMKGIGDFRRLGNERRRQGLPGCGGLPDAGGLYAAAGKPDAAPSEEDERRKNPPRADRTVADVPRCAASCRPYRSR